MMCEQMVRDLGTARARYDFDPRKGGAGLRVMARDLEAMAHALAGEVEPVLISQFIVLAARLEKRATSIERGTITF